MNYVNQFLEKGKYYMKKYENFCSSLKNMKEILEMHGFEEGATGSPKIILKTAYKAGMIKDETIWLQGLQARNNVTHSYNQKIALEIVRDAKEKLCMTPGF